MVTFSHTGLWRLDLRIRPSQREGHDSLDNLFEPLASVYSLIPLWMSGEPLQCSHSAVAPSSRLGSHRIYTVDRSASVQALFKRGHVAMMALKSRFPVVLDCRGSS